MARLKQRISILGAQQWVTGNTLADVLEKAIAKATEAANARCEAKPVAPTFGAFFEDYRASFWRGLRPNTLEAYKRSSKNHILPRFGDVPIDEITTTDIQQMYDDIADAGKAQETIKKVRNVMSPVMDYAVEQGIIAKNPLASKRLTIRGKETKPHKALTAEEMRHIRETMPSLPDDQRRLMALMCWSGERIGEILGFRWEDIDMPNGVLHINRGVTHPTRNQATVGEPKTKNSLRTVTLTSAMLEMLKPMQSSGFILGGEKPLSYSVCRALVKKSLAAVDAAGYTSHDFRDTCATEWMEAGVNMKVISQMLGHADINVTARRYTKVRENSLESAAEAINNYQQKLACV